MKKAEVHANQVAFCEAFCKACWDSHALLGRAGWHRSKEHLREEKAQKEGADIDSSLGSVV